MTTDTRSIKYTSAEMHTALKDAAAVAPTPCKIIHRGKQNFALEMLDRIYVIEGLLDAPSASKLFVVTRADEEDKIYLTPSTVKKTPADKAAKAIKRANVSGCKHSPRSIY